MPRLSLPSDIPSLIYDHLRAIHESRIKRTDPDPEVIILPLSNFQIFCCMPDNVHLNWTREAQPALIEETLATMEMLQRGATQPGAL